MADLPTSPDELNKEYQRITAEIQSCESRIESLVKKVPTINGIDTREYLQDIDVDTTEFEEDDSLDAYWNEATKKLPPLELEALEGLSSLGGQLCQAKTDRDVIRIRAIVLDVALLGDSFVASVRQKLKRRPGPKGQRPSTIARRTAIKLLKAQGKTGKQACARLDELKIPLPSKRLREIYNNSWVEWFNFSPDAFYKQWSADLKRGVT